MNLDLYYRFEHVVAQVANEMGRKYHTYGADNTDFAQEFALWMMKNDDKLVQKLEDDGDERFERYLAHCLRNEGKDYGLDIKAQACGYERHDVYHYAAGELEPLLEAMFDEESWLNPPQSEGRTVKDPAHGGNWVATLADVSRAYAKLSVLDQETLADFHKSGWGNRELAEMNGISEQAQSGRHERAKKRLLHELGGEQPKPGRGVQPGEDPTWRGRHAVSNAAARATQGSYYEEG